MHLGYQIDEQLSRIYYPSGFTKINYSLRHIASRTIETILYLQLEDRFNLPITADLNLKLKEN